MPEKQPTVYVMASKRNGTIYTGVTSDLLRRDYQHKQGETGGFTNRYGCHLLVWFEQHSTMESAITREKQVKSWKRAKKLALIEAMNPEWKDLSAGLWG